MIVLGHILQNLFNRCYTIIKLNLMFWLFSLVGGVILGIGPSLLALLSIREDLEWNYKDMTLSLYFERFKLYFKKGNSLFYLYFILMSLVSYNLFLSVQVKGIVFLVIDFILFFALLFFTLTFMFSQIILVRYDIKLLNALKLGMILFFMNFMDILKVIVGLIIIGFITYKSPALILFGTIAATQFFLLWRTKDTFNKFEKHYFGGHDEQVAKGEWL